MPVYNLHLTAKSSSMMGSFMRLLSVLIVAPILVAADKPTGPKPTHADVAYGPHLNQRLDVHLPPQPKGPCPVLIWYGGIWKPARHVPGLMPFFDAGCAVVAVQTRTMTDATGDKAAVPISYVLDDACLAVQYVKSRASEWGLDPDRIAVGGGSQGSLPALYVACSPDRAQPESKDPVQRQSTRVIAVAAFRSQPSIDPRRMQEWVPGVEWGAPALGCSFPESLKRRDELLPIIQKWSPDHLLHPGVPPIYFENEWGLTQPPDVTETNYKVHSPMWGLGFQKLAAPHGVTVLTKYLDHPTQGYKDTWDFLVKQLTAPQP